MVKFWVISKRTNGKCFINNIKINLKKMSNYFIHIDSSVENTKQGISYGKASAAWTIVCNGSKIRAGLIYSQVNGPNKIIYEGILASLSTLEPEHFCSAGSDNVFIYIDSQIVINQIDDIKGSKKMTSHLNLVRKMLEKHPNVSFAFLYKNEKDVSFKEVDILSKQGRRWIPKIVKFS